MAYLGRNRKFYKPNEITLERLKEDLNIGRKRELLIFDNADKLAWKQDFEKPLTECLSLERNPYRVVCEGREWHSRKTRWNERFNPFR